MVTVGKEKKMGNDNNLIRLSNDKIKKNYYNFISPHTDKNNKKQKLLKLNKNAISLLEILSVLEEKNQSEFVEKLIKDAAKHYIDNYKI